MTPIATKILEDAKSLPREERLELVHELIETLEQNRDRDETRLSALRTAVNAGIASLDAGQGISIPEGGFRDYLRERGQRATERANSKAA